MIHLYMNICSYVNLLHAITQRTRLKERKKLWPTFTIIMFTGTVIITVIITIITVIIMPEPGVAIKKR